MKLIITGGRTHRLTKDNIEQLNGIKNVTELVSGHASGVDQDAEKWAKVHNIPVRIFLPDWKRYGRGAGPVRNKAMAKYGDVLAAFPGGAGTRNMIKDAKNAGLEIYDFTSNVIDADKAVSL